MPSKPESTLTRRDLLGGTALGAVAAITPAVAATGRENDKDRSLSLAGFRPCASPNAPLHELRDKVAFITGGSSGIGLGIAQACIQAGMKVVITYRSKDHLTTALSKLPSDPDRVHAIKLDVTDAPEFRRAADECVRVFGKVHLLVNNAGVQNASPLSTISREQWDQLMNVNVNGVLTGIQTFLPYLTQHKEGAHIVSTSSILGLFTIGGSYAAYCASKFAVVAMMETLRVELAESRVGVSVLCPGVVKSNLEKGLADAPAASDPVEVGVRLLEGVRRNDMYVLTHPEFRPIIRDRCTLIEQSTTFDGPINEAREALASSATAATIYRRELARTDC